MGAPANLRAFPSGDFAGCEPGYGMTMREYYAGQALANAAICTGSASKWEIDRWFGTVRTGIMCHEVAARQALEHADALLAALAQARGESS